MCSQYYRNHSSLPVLQAAVFLVLQNQEMLTFSALPYITTLTQGTDSLVGEKPFKIGA